MRKLFLTLGGFLLLVTGVAQAPSAQATSAGITWTSQASAANNAWRSVTYGNGLFVAVSLSGSGNRVMTSPDGITWTARTSAANNNWSSVTYGNGLFVAVSSNGTGNRVMTSLNGITWTSQASAADNQWSAITYGNGLFVAVSDDGFGDRVMTSPDGITWTPRFSAADNAWRSVTYGNGLFVAVSEDGTGNRVMTSRTIGGGGSSTDSETLPAPIVLEFGKPASGTCEAAAPVSLNWAGVPSGGWANSWSQWMNGGTGGFVCTRTLVYSSTQAKWVIG
jgi:predicted RecA/RadA family phage recombinase